MNPARLRLATVATASLALVSLAACGSSGSTGSTGASTSAAGGAAPASSAAADTSAPAAAAGTKTELSLLVDNGEFTVKAAKAEIDAFQKANPDVTIKLNTHPGGGDGDNLVKTKLATGTMEDVFWYNSGSLLQALKPDQNLVDLTGDPTLKDVDQSFLPVVTYKGKVYGAPWGTVMGGGIVYNKEVFAKLGLSVPKTWAEFSANNEKIKAAGITPVLGTMKDTWTTQLFVLGDYHNVAVANPTFADDYTNNKAKYATTPAALRGFEKTAEPSAKGWLNKSAGSTTVTQGTTLLVSGKAAQWPILTAVVASLPKDQANKLGFFGIPGDLAATAGATVWSPAGQYISAKSKSIDAAKKFVAFVASPAGTEVFNTASPATGPYLIKGYTLPTDTLDIVKDLQAYVDSKATTPALEFLSPVKGPALEQITTATMSGQTKAKDAAAQYDNDVTKQAKQLGLAGW
jgi:raffinose/stachyose/melibiose transport system substrate-binding protein